MDGIAVEEAELRRDEFPRRRRTLRIEHNGLGVKNFGGILWVLLLPDDRATSAYEP